MIEQRNEATEFLFVTPPYSGILYHIGEGAENRIHLKDLTAITNMSGRELRRVIEFIRRKGVVIAAGKSGYYFPSDVPELSAFIKQEERRAKSTFYTLKAARQLEKDLTALEV